MEMPPNRSNPDAWIEQIFMTKSARRGGVVRRSISWVDREVGRDRFFSEVRNRGFRLIRTADQFIVICHRGSIELVL